MATKKRTTKHKTPVTLSNRVKKWNSDRAKLVREAAAIQREANKRGLSVKLTRK